MSHSLSQSLPTGGKVRPITRWGNPILHREVQDVTSFDDELATVVADMAATMYASTDGAIGLAANQIGVDLKVFVFDCPNAHGKRICGVVCNPVLELPASSQIQTSKYPEGCLSLPGPFTECSRPNRVTIRGVNEHNEPIQIHGTGTLAMCLQHEYDHLQGTVFGDRISDKARQKLNEEHEAMAKQFLDDWPVSARIEQSS